MADIYLFLLPIIEPLMHPPTLKHKTSYLSINPEGASLFIKVNGADTWNLPCLLNVVAVAADGQAHQIRSHHELLLEGRHKLPGALHKHKSKVIHLLALIHSQYFNFVFIAKTDRYNVIKNVFKVIDGVTSFNDLIKS